MKIFPHTNLPDLLLPLPIFDVIHIADAIGKDGAEFSAFVGLGEKYAEQLRLLSLNEEDEELQKNTSDLERFGLGSYKDWYGKNRTPFSLIHKQSDALAALVWFGPKPLFENEDNWHTAAWRSYNPFRGKGLMKNFTRFAMEIYQKSFPEGRFWAVFKKSNAVSIKLATGLGFSFLQDTEDGSSIIIVK